MAKKVIKEVVERVVERPPDDVLARETFKRVAREEKQLKKELKGLDDEAKEAKKRAAERKAKTKKTLTKEQRAAKEIKKIDKEPNTASKKQKLLNEQKLAAQGTTSTDAGTKKFLRETANAPKIKGGSPLRIPPTLSRQKAGIKTPDAGQRSPFVPKSVSEAIDRHVYRESSPTYRSMTPEKPPKKTTKTAEPVDIDIDALPETDTDRERWNDYVDSMFKGKDPSIKDLREEISRINKSPLNDLKIPTETTAGLPEEEWYTLANRLVNHFKHVAGQGGAARAVTREARRKADELDKFKRESQEGVDRALEIIDEANAPRGSQTAVAEEIVEQPSAASKFFPPPPPQPIKASRAQDITGVPSRIKTGPYTGTYKVGSSTQKPKSKWGKRALIGGGILGSIYGTSKLLGDDDESPKPESTEGESAADLQKAWDDGGMDEYLKLHGIK